MSKNKGTTNIKQLTFKEHVKKRSMWLGSSAVAPHEIWIMRDGVFVKELLDFSDALYKCIDEIIVNALDQYVNAVTNTAALGGAVTTLKIAFDVETGAITVYNDGQGMPVYMMKDVNTGEDVWTVEAIISRERTGSNFDDDGSPDRVTGGINGLGVKLVNAMSALFEVETVDWNNLRYYKQVCSNGMDTISPPIIFDIKKDKADPEFKKLTKEQLNPHTSVKFIPNYSELCKNGKKSDPNWYNEERGADILKIIESRVYQLSAFIASTNYRYDQAKYIEYKKKGKVYFNNELLPIKTLRDYVDMFGLRNYAAVELRDTRDFTVKKDDAVPHIKFPWTIVVNVSQAVFQNEKPIEGDDVSHDAIEYKKFEQVNLVNGVFLPSGGSHVNLLFNMIEDALHLKIEKLLGQKFRDEKEPKKTKALPLEVLKNNLFIFNCIQIPIPQFAGQTKDSITLTKAEINNFKKVYELPSAFIKKIWDMLKPVLEYKFLIKGNSKKTKSKNYVRKCHHAKKFGPNASLIVPEGDSAETTMNSIITNRKANLGYKDTGSYNIQGVPMNALKEIKEIVVGKHSKLQQSKRLRENVALQGLAQVLNLNYDYDYYYVEDQAALRRDLKSKDPEILAKARADLAHQNEGDRQYATLKYQKGVIVAVDQDTDGIGQIFGLFVVFFGTFFPSLIKRGFLKRFATPLIRVYPAKGGGNTLEFYSLAEFKKWRHEMFGIDLTLPDGREKSVEDAGDIPKDRFRVKYYKGLATHSKAEVQHMAECFADNVYTYQWDEFSKKYIDIMYGNDTSLRKVELRTPVSAIYDQELFESQIVKISDQLQIETKTFQLEFMERKLPSAIDGMIPSQRKAFAGARRIWANGGKEMKVYQLTGYVTEKLHYQHGGAAMDETITKMAQIFTGANNLPLLVPISNGFGDRDKGRGKTSAARYIEVKLNKKMTDIMFPRCDDFLLEYAYDDGEKCEPKYVPIMPMAILNTTTTVSVGWRILSWARDFTFTLEQVRNMIKYDYPAPAGKPRNFTGKVWLEPGMSAPLTMYSQSSAKAAEVCLGSYVYNEKTNIVHVTQLPLKVWSYPLRCEMIGVTPDKENETTNKSGTPLPRKELVEDVSDETGNNIVDMKIKLIPGAYEQICEKYGTSDIDPIEDYLGLKQNLAHDINMISKEGTVMEFKSYAEVLEHWFPVRKQLYIDRLERERLLLEFEIIYYKQVQQYILMEKNKEINLNDIQPEEQEAELVSHGFIRINHTLLFAPKYTKADELRVMIFGTSEDYGNATYDYILDKITKRMASTKAIKERADKIEELEKQLAKLMASTYKEIWLDELDELEVIVQEGIRTQWLYGMKKHTFKKMTTKNLKDKEKKGKQKESEDLDSE